MHRPQRLISAALLVAIATTVSGCASMGSSFEPSDLLDWMDTKKKLPGERKPVFPEGVPGVQQGVPREMYRGYNEQQQVAPPVVEQAEPVREPPRQRAKRAAAPRRAAPAPVQEQQEAAPPPPPASTSSFPAPLPSGSFQR